MSTKSLVVSGRFLKYFVFSSCLAGAMFSAMFGRVSPGLASVIVYLGLFGITVMVQQQYGKNLSKGVICIISVGIFVLPSVRLLGIALRHLGPISFHFEAIAQGVLVFFTMLGVAEVIASIVKTQTKFEE